MSLITGLQAALRLDMSHSTWLRRAKRCPHFPKVAGRTLRGGCLYRVADVDRYAEVLPVRDYHRTVANEVYATKPFPKPKHRVPVNRCPPIGVGSGYVLAELNRVVWRNGRPLPPESVTRGSWFGGRCG